MAREGVPLIVIRRLLGHSNLGITSVYLQGDSDEIRATPDHGPGAAPLIAQSASAVLARDWLAVRPRRGGPVPAAPLRFGGHLPGTAADWRQSSA
jgi:hypothetical protein